MQDPQPEEQRGIAQTLGWFALVSYIPDALAHFLDELRVDFSPTCNPRAHVTVLPPRPHHSNLKETIASIRETVGRIPPFTVEAGDVKIFDVSNVVYIGLARGAEELGSIYRALNCGRLAFKEPFEYHPHITLAQQLDRREALRLAAVSQRRWAQYDGPRTFEVSKLSFVQHVAPTIWADVATISTGVRPADASGADVSEPFQEHFGEVFQSR